MDLKLIENITKKKKTETKDITNLNKILFDTIDTIINCDFNKTKSITESELYIKDNLEKMIELYININRNLKNINNTNLLITKITDDIIDNVIFRCEDLKNEEIKCVIENIKEKKSKENNFKIMMTN